MTYNVFGGTLNLAQSNLSLSIFLTMENSKTKECYDRNLSWNRCCRQRADKTNYITAP